MVPTASPGGMLETSVGVNVRVDADPPPHPAVTANVTTTATRLFRERRDIDASVSPGAPQE